MKILICDDEIEIVNALKEYLESKGCAVEYALDGKKGLSLIRSENYDIAFLDINMPGLTGIEILRHIKDNKISTKAIFLTGYPCINENFAKALRADEYLEKPIDLKMIGEIVDKYAKA